MSTTILIRRAMLEDAETIAAMASALARAEGKPPAHFSAADFRRLAAEEPPFVSTFVAEQEGAPVGYALYYPGYDTESATRGMFLSDLFVDETVRRRGVGRALVAAVARACAEGGGNWLAWFVLPTNRPALAFYERIGAVCPVETPMVLQGEPFAALLRGRDA